jgi:putative transposase
LFTLFRLFFSPRAALVAEILFLRKQLALFQERKVKRRRTTPAFRITTVVLARFFNWRDALLIVKPETLLRWHRNGFRRFWRWKSSKPGRPPLPLSVRELVREMAQENPTWGEERIADELKLKLGIRLSPRTVSKYLDRNRSGGGSYDQRWGTFVRNHAKAIVACDFFVSVTATFQLLYVFVAMEIGTRRILHCNITAHPQQNGLFSSFGRSLPTRILINSSFTIEIVSFRTSSTLR